MALNCCAFSVSSSTGVRGSVVMARGGGRKRKGRGRSLLEKFVVFVEKIF